MTFRYIQKSRKDYLERKFLISKSVATREGYDTALRVFDKFAKEIFAVDSGDAIINDLKKLKADKILDETFEVLQLFVNYLAKTRNPRTVKDYLARLRDYLYYNGIKIDNRELRSSVTVPRPIRDMGYAITKDDIKKILDNAKLKRKALYLTLLSSGMRIGEAVGLRKRDFDLNQDRICITIPAILTKLKTQRQTYISKEAEEYVRPIIKRLSQDDLIFGTNLDREKSRLTEEKLFDRVRVRAGLTDKYENRNRHKISLHTFRSFCETVASNTFGEEYAHALIGHSGYMSVYYRLGPEERLQKYMQIEPYLTIHGDADFVKTADEMRKKMAELAEKNKGLENLAKRVEDLEYGSEARKNELLRAVYDLEHGDKTRLLEVLIRTGFELMAPEEQKRALWKKLKNLKEGETLGMSDFGESNGLSLKNYYDDGSDD